MKQVALFFIVLSILAAGCSESPKSGQDSTTAKKGMLIANRDKAGEWESFTIINK